MIQAPGGAGAGRGGSGGVSGRVKVLLITSSASEAGRLRRAVAESGAAHIELQHAAEIGDAMRLLAADRFDAMLLDLSVAPGHELDALARIHERAADIPILVLTAADDDALAIEALKAGAQDSLGAGRVDGYLLARAVRYAIERHQLQVALQAMALVDDLTGLYNRRGFETLARKQLKMADRMGKLVSSIFIDVDGLKLINDTFGHREGDLALIETAMLLRETFRESDIIARIGGDEFVVLAMESTGHGGEQWTARLREKLHARNAHPGRRVTLSLSVGIAHYDPDFPCALDDLLDRADALMYDEKRRMRRRRPRGPAPRYGGAGEPDTAPRAD